MSSQWSCGSCWEPILWNSPQKTPALPFPTWNILTPMLSDISCASLSILTSKARMTEYFSSCSSIADAIITSRFTTGPIFTCATGILEVLKRRGELEKIVICTVMLKTWRLALGWSATWWPCLRCWSSHHVTLHHRIDLHVRHGDLGGSGRAGVNV